MESLRAGEPVQVAEPEIGSAPAGAGHGAAELVTGQVRGLRDRAWRSAALDGRAWVAICAVGDALMLGLAVAASLIGASAAGVEGSPPLVVWLFPPLAMAGMAVRGLYRPRLQIRLLDDIGRVLGATSVAAMSILAFVAVTASAADQAGMMARLWIFSTVYVAGGRLVLGLSQRQARAAGVAGRATLIVGSGRVGAQVERRLEEQPELGLRAVGFVDGSPAPDDLVPGRRAPVLGGPDELEEIVERVGAQHVILAFMSSRGSDARMVPIVRKCEELGLDVSLVPRLWENMNVRAELEHLGGMPLFRLSPVKPKSWQFIAKHSVDRAGAALLIALLAPLLVTIAIGVKLSSRGPVFYRQRRVGRDGREFDLLKFRSMRVTEEQPAGPNVVPFLPLDVAPGGVEGADRRTPLGRLLRRSSLDELPQLLNVLKGDMSLVGPRPERPEYVELFERRLDRYDDRLRVKAGITGWAQVHRLRGKTSLSDRIEWDNYYIENWSLLLDLKILLMTVTAVFHDSE